MAAPPSPVFHGFRHPQDRESSRSARLRHVCYEVLEGGFLAATNVFVREDGAWRMVHHQAGASPPPTAADEDASETMQ